MKSVKSGMYAHQLEVKGQPQFLWKDRMKENEGGNKEKEQLWEARSIEREEQGSNNGKNRDGHKDFWVT